MNKSSPPFSGVINPNPFWSLNHFTVPLDKLLSLSRLSMEAPLNPLFSQQRTPKGYEARFASTESYHDLWARPKEKKRGALVN
jgi:hypothetical protein